jgi:aminoglycoside 6'-N-acetyltransferase I
MQKVCKFKTEYLSELARMYIEVFNSEPWFENWRLDYARKRLKYFLPQFNNFSRGFVCKANNEIFGFLGGTCLDYEQEKIFIIDEIFIKRNRQNQGLGTKFLNAVMGLLKKQNINRLELKTLRNSFLEKFFRKNGFDDSNRVYLAKNS